ncbi:MAG: FMN-dependent NADH-azoreductase, partial [Mesorhizobium sp.]
MSILLITSSPRGAASHSTRIATEFAEKLVAADPSNTLVVRDLVANPLPHIDADYASGIYVPAEARTGFINFNISSTLKSWVDHISRSGKSFSYGENGPKGLVTGKKVYIVLASGGIYSEGAAVQFDHAIPYLRGVLG